MDLKVRKYLAEKTNVSNYDQLRNVQRSLSTQSATSKMNARRALSRKCQPQLTQSTSTPLTSKGQNPRYSQGPFLVGNYVRASDGFEATSTVQPDEQFLGYQIRNGAMGTGDVVRGWHIWGSPTGYLEPNPKGREFPPIENPQQQEEVEKEVVIEFDLFIAFTGKRTSIL